MPNAIGKTVKIARLEGGGDRRTFQEIEALHRAQLAAGTLAHMPTGFLASFYRYLANRTDCVVLTVEQGGRMSGFAAGTLHASGLLKSFAVAKPLEIVGYSAKLLLEVRLLFRVLSLAGHFVAGAKQSHMDERQLLSIAVDPGCSRLGMGTDLFNALCDWFRICGAENFGIIAARTQTAALQFYKRRGATEVGETRLAGLDSVCFRYVLHPADSNREVSKPRSREGEK
jgi:ribosomal protein S18 acetylase RimI-like enzyme